MNRLLANLMRDVPISRKLMLLIMLTCGVILVTVSLIFVASELITIRKEQREDLASLADIVAKNTSSALIFGDPEAARETMSTLSERSDIMAAYLLDVDGRIFARYIAPEKATESLPLERRASGSAPVVAATLRAIQAEGDRLFSMAGFGSLVRPISNNGQPLGTVVLHSDMSRFLQHLISAPILALAKMMRDVSHAKNFALRAMRTSNDEIGLLFDGFNEMLYEIEERNETLRMRHEHLQQLENDEALVTAIIAVADSLKLRVVAEGVETMDQLLKLTRQGCHEVQGYLVSPPVPAAQFRDIMPLPPFRAAFSTSTPSRPAGPLPARPYRFPDGAVRAWRRRGPFSPAASSRRGRRISGSGKNIHRCLFYRFG